MREFRSHRPEEESAVPAPRQRDADRDTSGPETTEPGAGTEPFRLPPLLSRRHTPWLLVEVDGSSSRHGALVWALREAARREATVLAVTVPDDGLDHPLGAPHLPSAANQATALQVLDAQVLRAIAETGVHGRVRTAVLERAVFDAINAAASGADLVVIGAWGKTLLRPAVGRPPFRRLSRGA